MKRLLFFILLGMAAFLRSEESGTLDRKAVFTRGWPQFLAFRGEMSRPSHSSYEAWCGSVQGASGVIRKFLPEELPKIYRESAGWAARYAQENPQILMMLHLNGEARQVLDFPDVHERYFPGHWIYCPGSELTADIGSEDTELYVQDARPFKIKAYLNRQRNGEKSWFPQHIILVPVDSSGRRLWYESEYAVIQAVDYQRNTISVERGQIFSHPRSFKAGRTCVAPLAAGVWGGAPMWFYNLSSACPKDRDGHSAADVFAAEIAEWFSTNGLLSGFDGVAFDVNYWKVRDASWDTDNDNQSDGGLIGGANVWREGDWAFLGNLRAALGDRRVVTGDGQHPQNQQAVGVLDGIESEGLVQHNDGFRGFSRTVNTHLYWQQNNPRKYDFRYVVLKLMDPNDAERGDQLRRFATATACCLEAFVTGTSAPFLPDGFAEPGSLGFPTGNLIRPAQNAADLLEGKGLKHLSGDDCTLRKNGNALQVVAEDTDDPLQPMTVTLEDLNVPSGDLTLFVTMEAIEPLEGVAPADRVPRLVQAGFSSVPDYGEGARANELYTDLYGYIGTHGPSVLSFYLRRPDCGPETMDVTFRIEGRGKVQIDSITAHNAPDILVREFDHGIVAVNPSFNEAELPSSGSLPAMVVPPLDACFIKKGP